MPQRIANSLVRLAFDPHAAPNLKALSDGTLRLRVGDWRVIHTLHDDVLLILVLPVGHHRDVRR